jgi:hypothetical protein
MYDQNETKVAVSHLLTLHLNFTAISNISTGSCFERLGQVQVYSHNVGSFAPEKE